MIVEDLDDPMLVLERLLAAHPDVHLVATAASVELNISYLKQVDKTKGICILKNGPEEIKIPLSTSKIWILEKALEKKLFHRPL